ncbi:endonuclease domain-containing protein [Candidatus Berkiella cookevillensis]|uniref:Endonuclease domain-containing protein n=1 Tax=Candidatus Berkiella cookevillensis TaxID=437022 RepID=A0A0Q9YB47_9GAMM|nr:endonuclease domain-containing protein [Candidatus Berkiella cookevillensis]MCS5709010.1 endonuclease domain-containing protein [Candidatus Berkiella cookevillensis]
MIQASRDLKEKVSVAEQRLWEYFRDGRFCNVNFNRQFVLGAYIVNFVSPEHKLVIEINAESSLESADYHARKITYLKSLGYKIIHFWDHDILHNIRIVLEVIHNEVDRELV